MKIYNLSDFTQRNSLPEGCSAALGNFDGVHIGHRALFDEVKKNENCAVWTFFSPAKPNSPAEYLTDTAERLRLFSECGVKFAILEDFPSVKALTPEKFVGGILKEKLKLSSVVCGFNFHFGKDGAGNSETLRSLCEKYSMGCTVVDPVLVNGAAVSSSEIKKAVTAGDMESAALYLGRPYSFAAPVIHGKSLAGKFDIPTVNQHFPDGYVRPGNGVYAAAVAFEDKIFPGAVNVGVRPTFRDGGGIVCETHIIGFSGDLYGKEIRISFLKKIRDEIEFADENALFERIKEDITACSEIFGSCSERNLI